MAKKQFKAQSKRLLEMMIHSIYSQKEIFLRELISNASDAIDKSYYAALGSEEVEFDREKFVIRLTPDKEARTLAVSDMGVGMDREELENNLGTIAESGSLRFKKEMEEGKDVDIIGQFGVGFYSAFMVAKKVTVLTKRAGGTAWLWTSEGADGYTIKEAEKEDAGTVVTLYLKDDAEGENYSEYLDEFRLRSLVRKYSDFIRYPIKMLTEERRLKEGSEDEYETVTEDKTLNSMVPVWRKNKNELTDEDYENFYKDRHYGYEKPLRHIHTRVDGDFSYIALQYVPAKAPFDYYSKSFEKGLSLYSNGVMIMEKCPELLPDYFGFMQGLVDSADISLNISREILQQDRTLKLIAKNLEKKIRAELLAMLKDDRENYEKFFKEFGRQIKYGLYDGWGANKETLQDLVIFYSGKEQKMITLKEYVDALKEDDKYIYYATGESTARVGKLPQAESVLATGKDVLFFTDEVDEFAVQMMREYGGREFKNVSSVDPEEDATDQKPYEDVIKFCKETLGDKVADVAVSDRLREHPVCLRSRGSMSIEMEKTLAATPQGDMIKAQKVLQINASHAVTQKLTALMKEDPEKAKKLVGVLYAQALLIEGLAPEDPVAYANDVCALVD